MNKKNICGERIRLARLRLKMSQMDVSAALEVDCNLKIDGSTVGKIERMERGVYDFELVAFSKILDVSVDWLVTSGEVQFQE